MVTKQFLKIYGERNTGTNYLSELTDLNLQVQQLPGVIPKWLSKIQQLIRGKEFARDAYFSMTYHQNLGWKHSQAKSVEDICNCAICSRGLSFVTLTKNPYSWLLSMYRRPYHRYFSEKSDFETFLVTPWKSVDRENISGDISSPVELWNIKNASYIQLAKKLPVLTLKFEDLLDDPEQVLKLISERFSWSWKVEQFINYDQSTKESSKDSEFYRDYYLNGKWKEELSARSISIINKRLDDNVMNYFNYQKLTV